MGHNFLRVIVLSQSTFVRTIENACQFGRPVLLEDVPEALDPVLETVLLKGKYSEEIGICGLIMARPARPPSAAVERLRVLARDLPDEQSEDVVSSELYEAASYGGFAGVYASSSTGGGSGALMCCHLPTLGSGRVIQGGESGMISMANSRPPASSRLSVEKVYKVPFLCLVLNATIFCMILS